MMAASLKADVKHPAAIKSICRLAVILILEDQQGDV